MLPAVAALAVAAAVYVWVQGRGADASAAPVRAGERVAGSPLPRIDLARLDAPRPEARIGQRDLFDFEPEPTPPPPPPTPPPAPTPVPSPTPTPLPPLNLKYVGTVEGEGGVKIAVFLTERKEVLYGRVGDTVANRIRVVKIGIESVDVQEVGTDQNRRIPLKGN